MLDANEILKAGQMGGKGQSSGNNSFVSTQFITIPSTTRSLWEEEQANGSLDKFSPIDKRGLLFRPVPATPVLPRIPVTPDSDLEDKEKETDALLPGVLSLIQAITDRLPTPPAIPSVTQAVTSRLPVPPAMSLVMQAITARLPTPALSSAKRKTRKRAILWPSLLAIGVLLVYMFAPLVLTLIPLLPTNWSRVLIAFQLLLLAEIIIYRILYRTTRRNNRNKAERKVA